MECPERGVGQSPPADAAVRAGDSAGLPRRVPGLPGSRERLSGADTGLRRAVLAGLERRVDESRIGDAALRAGRSAGLPRGVPVLPDPRDRLPGADAR